MKKEDEDRCIFESAKVISATADLIPSMKDQVLKHWVELLFFLFDFSNNVLIQ